ncbi:hypothetical protein [Metallosphaera sp.]|uniref:hypothetical protein n=1 Tax=Metallosphaera sp. TaxID=2020860 RepID=UPI003176AE9E
MAATPTQPALPANAVFNRVSGTSTSQLTIPSRVNYRNKLLDFFVTNPPSGGYADISVGSRVYMRVPFQVSNSFLIGSPVYKVKGLGFLWYFASELLKDVGYLPDAAEDEDINITLSSGATRIDAYYLQYQTQDVTSHSIKGGSDFPQKPFIDIFTGSSTTVGTGQKILSENEPTGLNLLDNTGRISPTTTYEVYTLVADYVSSGTNNTEYQRLHVFDEEIELYTPLNHEGLLIDETIPANDLRFDLRNQYYFRQDKPYLWQPSHKMNLLVDVAAVTGTGSPLYVYLLGLKTKTGVATGGTATAGGA